MVALNSNCSYVSCATGSAQEQWLRGDLAAHTGAVCTLAFWHHPPYTKGTHDSDNPLDSEGKMTDMRTRVLPILDSTGAPVTGVRYDASEPLRGDGRVDLGLLLATGLMVGFASGGWLLPAMFLLGLILT